MGQCCVFCSSFFDILPLLFEFDLFLLPSSGERERPTDDLAFESL